MNSVSNDSAETMRHAMVASQLRPNAVSDARVVAAMARVSREDYLPEAARDMAYRDTALPIGRGRLQNVPMATGRLMTEALLQASDRVLLIGAAGGYTAAVLAEIVASVTAVESDPALADLARSALAGKDNVEMIEAPLQDGHAAGGPYDVLFIDGAIPQLPDTLIAQVKVGGRVVGGIADVRVTRLAAGRRTEGGFALVPFADIECVPLPGFARATSFTF